MKRVFDGDNMRLLETFEEKDRERIIRKYEEQGFEVLPDRDGDLVIFEQES